MVFKFISIVLCFFFTSCHTRQPEYIRLSDGISGPYAKELKKEKGLNLDGSGGSMMDDVKKVNATYLSFAKLSVNEARNLYVEVVEGYLERYNRDEQIRPYLHNYPFNSRNIGLMITFEDEYHRRREGEDVTLMFMNEGNIVYRGYDHNKEEFVPLHRESYEEAVRIVRGGDSGSSGDSGCSLAQ